MPTTRRARRGHRLAGGALAALLAVACDGTTAPATPTACDPTPVEVTAGQAWQLYGPADWQQGCALTVRAPALAADERLALVLVNAGGLDSAAVTLSLAGTAAFAAAEVPVASRLTAPRDAAAPGAAAFDRGALDAGQALVVARRRAGMAWLAANPPAGETSRRALATAGGAADPALLSQRQFCVDKLTSQTKRTPEAMQATLVHASPNALYYVTNDRLAAVQALGPDLWTDFEDYFEGSQLGTKNLDGARRILPALHESFGQETDVDGNGKVIFLFANLVRHLTGGNGVIVGFFDPVDMATQDTSCTGSGSNQADMLYLMDPVTFISKGYTATQVLDEQLPGTMAHELQHDVIYNTRCRASRLASCSLLDDPSRDLWLNEGLSMVAEDFAGFGLSGASERGRVGSYLGCKRTGGHLCYQDVSLTTWPSDSAGDPDGHYGGSHAFVRWHLDQADARHARDAAAADGSAFARTLVASSQGARAALTAASGLSFEEGYARFAAAALFSGEDPVFVTYPLRPAPDFSFAPAPAPWGPLHTTVGRPAYTSLPRPGGVADFVASLHKDGWAGYVTGTGTGADTALTIRSTAAVKPRVAVLRFRGSLAQP